MWIDVDEYLTATTHRLNVILHFEKEDVGN